MDNKFLKEISEQPGALRDTLRYYLDEDGRHRIEEVKALVGQNRIKQVIFTGMGSSFFAPHLASCILSKYGIGSLNINAGELLHYHLPVLRQGVLLICISQSGESYEVIRLLEKIPPGIPVIGITNEEKSTLAGKAGITLLSRAGSEEMTSSKTYVSTLLVLSILSRVLAGMWQPSSVPELFGVIDSTDKLIKNSSEWLGTAMNVLGHPPFVQVIGRGPAYASVLQGALMFMEAARNPAAGIYGGEFRHGPLEMAKKGFRAIVFAPLGNTYSQGIKIAEDIARFEGKVVLITNNPEYSGNQDIYPVIIPCRDEYLFPIPAIIPLQFIVNQWAVDEGNQPGNFLMGAKVTTTE